MGGRACTTETWSTPLVLVEGVKAPPQPRAMVRGVRSGFGRASPPSISSADACRRAGASAAVA